MLPKGLFIFISLLFYLFTLHLFVYANIYIKIYFDAHAHESGSSTSLTYVPQTTPDKHKPRKLSNHLTFKIGRVLFNKWRAQSKNDPLIFRPFLKVFRSSWQLLLNTFKNGRKIKGSFLLWTFQMIHYFIFVLPVICNAANSNLVNENVLIKWFFSLGLSHVSYWIMKCLPILIKQR